MCAASPSAQLIFSQRKEFLPRWDRFLGERGMIEVAFAKSMPEPKEPRMQRQGIAGEVIRDRSSGELLYSKQVSFQVSPSELSDTLVVLDIGAEAIGAKGAQELRLLARVKNTKKRATKTQSQSFALSPRHPVSSPLRTGSFGSCCSSS
jgi:hypothetical protein